MITPRSPHGESADDDPTGVRALLAALPDPGPMPADLVERITRRLHEEAQARPLDQPQAPDRTTAARLDSSATITPLVRRRSPLQVAIASLGSVAAVAMIGLIIASIPHSPQGSASSGAAMQTSTKSLASTKTPAGSSAHSSGAAPHSAYVSIRTVATGHAYTPASFVAQASSLTPVSGPQPALGTGTSSTTTALAGCVHAVESTTQAAAPTSVVVDRASYAGAPALILVLRRGTSLVGYAVARSCSAQVPHILHGPVRLH